MPGRLFNWVMLGLIFVFVGLFATVYVYDSGLTLDVHGKPVILNIER